MNVTVAITGASGSIYARQLLEALVDSDKVHRITVICSGNGAAILEHENERIPESEKIKIVANDDFYNHTASGSSCDGVMVIVPCSVGMMSRIACGISDDTISRAADVILKERKKLILVVREMPLNIIHINNMSVLAGAGAVIMPASPSFYSSPHDIEQLCMTVTGRVLSLMGLDGGYRWCGEK